MSIFAQLEPEGKLFACGQGAVCMVVPCYAIIFPQIQNLIQFNTKSNSKQNNLAAKIPINSSVRLIA